ncbi:hypothetical protein NM208_g8205 [Fusarium decemcellulare]|uniref:Uncharacterized protein n=1 Tax=Fusarium decemcellulare TaxID=57161 RepID=A0ACC1S6H4_9HYPO|nr:hypothetical protein NM208_g8205 [Fusarium decemcellulare]
MGDRDCTVSIAVGLPTVMPGLATGLSARLVPPAIHQPVMPVRRHGPALSENLNLLIAYGCFDIPNRDTLEPFFENYFLYIHPFMPILNEAHFWKAFTSSSGIDLVAQGKLPLALLFAMLYTVTTFVPVALVEHLGFKDIHHAKSTFYQRAELLYDCLPERSSIVKAQTALLLSHSYYTLSPTSPSDLATLWLSRAIHHAESSGAQHYDDPSPAAEKQQNTLKRLWWCCIIRDRIMPLTSRRGIRITRTTFDFQTKPPFGKADLFDEIDHSNVYDRATKLVLVDLLQDLVEFCVVLTDILETSYSNPMEGVTSIPFIEQHEHFIQDYRRRLKRIRKSALGGPFGYTSRSPHSSIALFANLSIMYTCAAETVLSHCRILLADYCFIGEQDAVVSTRRHGSCERVQVATHDIIECLGQLVQSRLTHLLPLSAVGCALFPLLLQILDCRLRGMSTPNKHGDINNADLTQQNFMLLIQAMQVPRLRHAGVDWILESVRVIVARFSHSFSRGALSRWTNSRHYPVSSWSDILQYQPRFYLSLSTMLDLCLSNGRMPESNDLPLHLRLMASSDLPTAMELFYNGIPESLNPDDLVILSNPHRYSSRLRSHKMAREEEADSDETVGREIESSLLEPYGFPCTQGSPLASLYY